MVVDDFINRRIEGKNTLWRKEEGATNPSERTEDREEKEEP